MPEKAERALGGQPLRACRLRCLARWIAVAVCYDAPHPCVCSPPFSRCGGRAGSSARLQQHRHPPPFFPSSVFVTILFNFVSLFLSQSSPCFLFLFFPHKIQGSFFFSFRGVGSLGPPYNRQTFPRSFPTRFFFFFFSFCGPAVLC